LQKAAALEKTVPLYPHIVAKLRMRQKRWKEALEPLAAARLLNPADPEIVFDQGIALQALGRTADAGAARTLHRTLVTARQRRRVVLSELARNPEPSKMRGLRRELARLYRTQGRLWDARRTLEGLGEDDLAVRAEIAVLDNDPRMTAQRLPFLSEAALIAEGNSLLQQENYADARSRFQEAVRRNAANAIALQGIGLSLLHQGRSLQAVPYFTEATEIMPGLIASQFYLGERALDFGLVQEAIARLEKATQLAPNDPQVWYRYHQALGRMDSRVNDQIAALQKCVTLTPDNPIYLMELGEAFVDAGKLDDAEGAFRKALMLAPDSVETQARLGGFLVNSRTNAARAEAAALLNRARKADPRHAYTRFSLGTLALKQGRAAEAVTLLQQAAQERPNLQESWYLLARAYTALGKTTEAREASRRSRQIQQESVDFLAAQEKLQDDVRDPIQRLKVARLCQKYQQPLKAMAHYRILLSQKPEHPEALREKAALERRLAQTGQGEEFAAFEEMLRAGTRAAATDTKQ
jgi:tetratricopeptide (TPR) repeat protein